MTRRIGQFHDDEPAAPSEGLTDHPRERTISEHDLEAAIERGAERALIRARTPYAAGRERATSTPPALAWLETRVGRFVTRTLLSHLLTVIVTAYAVLAWRECGAHKPLAPAPAFEDRAR